jgi:hypothetical protein
MLNAELAQIARDVITDMSKEGWSEKDIKWSVCGAILKQCEEQGQISDETMKEHMAALQARVLQILKAKPVVICLEVTPPITLATSFYYYHSICWHGLYTKPDGYISEVPIAEIASGTTCLWCQQEL